jgi:hypothetical protein
MANLTSRSRARSISQRETALKKARRKCSREVLEELRKIVGGCVERVVGELRSLSPHRPLSAFTRRASASQRITCVAFPLKSPHVFLTSSEQRDARDSDLCGWSLLLQKLMGAPRGPRDAHQVLYQCSCSNRVPWLLQGLHHQSSKTKFHSRCHFHRSCSLSFAPFRLACSCTTCASDRWGLFSHQPIESFSADFQ